MRSVVHPGLRARSPRDRVFDPLVDPPYRSRVTQERAPRTRRRAPRQDEETLDPEQAEALSRAAREAVRQPADPRLEKSFAHLGLVPDPEPKTAVKRTRTRRAAPVEPLPEAEPVPTVTPAERPATPEPVAPSAPAARPADVQSLVEAISTLTRSTDDIRRRLEILTWMLAGVLVGVALVALILLVRGA
jgi:hypothetical protein